MNPLDGKLYLITGASADSDIGLAICKRLDAEGARLILVGRREEALQNTLRQLNQKHHSISLFDLSQLEAIAAWVDELVKAHGAFDGLVYSACVQGYSPLRTVSAAQFNLYFEINTYAPLMLMAALARPGRYKEHASFISIGSAAGLRGLQARCLYAASKAALLSLTQSVALELAEKGIRVNYIAPAVVDSAKAQYMFMQLGEAQSHVIKAQHPLGLSTPTDISCGVYYLLSDQSRCVTGTSLIIDGGYLAG